MTHIINYKNPVKCFIIISTFLFAAIFLIENINNRFWLNDFKVFYLAAKALLQNEQVYGIPFGLDTGFYKYSPFTLLFFIPFTFISFEAASILYFFLIAVCSIATIFLLEKLITTHLVPGNRVNCLVYLSILLCVINHLVRELHLGNTNIIQIFLLSLSLKNAIESNPLRSGAFLAIAVLTKPYFLICLLPLLLYKKISTIKSIAAFLLLFITLPILFTGISKSVLLYSEWISAMVEHSGYLTSRHTLFSILDHYFGISIPASYGVYSLVAIGIISFCLLWLFDKKQNKDAPGSGTINGSLIIYFFLLVALIPNLLITDTEHFLFSLPLITVLILYLRKQDNYLWIIIFILVIFLYGANSSDLLGKNIFGKFEELGLLGISNLIIITSVIYLFYFKRDKCVTVK